MDHARYDRRGYPIVGVREGYAEWARTYEEMDEGLVDDDWLRAKPKWATFAGLPVSFAMVWRLA